MSGKGVQGFVTTMRSGIMCTVYLYTLRGVTYQAQQFNVKKFI